MAPNGILLLSLSRMSVGRAREAVARRLVWLHRGTGRRTLRYRAVPPYPASGPYIDAYGLGMNSILPGHLTVAILG